MKLLKEVRKKIEVELNESMTSLFKSHNSGVTNEMIKPIKQHSSQLAKKYVKAVKTKEKELKKAAKKKAKQLKAIPVRVKKTAIKRGLTKKRAARRK